MGLVPEQDWELPDLAASPFGSDPTLASIGFATGQPDGSAAPLTWAAAAFVRTAAGAGIREQRAIIADLSQGLAALRGETGTTITRDEA